MADAFKAAGVRLNAYLKRADSEGNIVIHVVNYNLPLAEASQHRKIVPVEDVEIRLRVPNGWNVQGVTMLDPGAEPQALSFECTPFLKLTLPRVTFYKLIHVSAIIQED